MRAGFWEIVLIVVLVLILFGHNKIPGLMKNLANGINIFKKEIKETKDGASVAVQKGAAAHEKRRATSTAAKKSPVKKVAAEKPVKKTVTKKPAKKSTAKK